MAKGSAAAPAQAPGPGAYFDIPGVGSGTQWTEQYESTKNLAVTASGASSTPVNGIAEFKRTDVVVDWQLVLSYALTYTASGATFAVSDYAPWNLLGSIKLPVQNQYAPVDVESGIDLYLFNMTRPFDFADESNMGYAPVGNFAGSTALGYAAAANAQPNLNNPAQFSTSTTTWTSVLRLAASASFDLYYDLALTGEPQSAPHAAIVSPQYMAGSARVITPSVTLNPLYPSTADVGAVTGTGGTPTTTGTATLSFKRKAVYSADPALLPPVYGWQYRWKTTRFLIGGSSERTFQVPLETGQLLMVYLRLFDPTAASNVGAPISLANVTSFQLQYGSGLFRFDGTPLELQRLWLAQHGWLPPKGVLMFDLGLDERGNRTNRRALNTLTTSGILLAVKFSGAQSTSSYAVMGTESLVYVA